MDPLGPVTSARVEITMADVVKTVVKDFNPALLEEELNATVVPTRDTFFAGFVRSQTDSNVATPQARTVFEDRVSGVKDEAAAGEIRFTFRNALTTAEDTALDTALTAHVATGTTSEQDRIDQDATDLDQLITDLPNIATMTDVQFKDHVERLTRVLVRDFKSPSPPV